MAEVPSRGDDPAAFEAFVRRYLSGQERLGSVSPFHFDLGVIETMRARRCLGKDGYQFYLKVPGVAIAPGTPGVPVVFGTSDDLYRSNTLPMVLVERTGMPYDRSRLQYGAQQTRTPAPGSQRFEVNGREGYSSYENVPAATPVTLEYTITILARNRGGGVYGAVTGAADMILQYIWKYYRHHCEVYVRDSSSPAEATLRDLRGYTAFGEDVVSEDQIIEVTGRITGHQMRLRVEGEIDIDDAEITHAVTGLPAISYTQ